MTDHDKPMSMVERVAMALVSFDMKNPYLTDEQRKILCAQNWHALIPRARAAISAMREPTEGMRRAGQDKCDDYLDAAECWPAMIDAALTEGK